MDFSVTTREILLIAHIGAAMLLIGPLVVATSLFPRHIANAIETPGEVAVARVLHRITRGYGNASIVVALLGVALVAESDLWTEPFVMGAVALFLIASGLIFGIIVPAQAEGIRLVGNSADIPARELAGLGAVITRLRAVSGVTALLWAAVLFLMVVKPS